MRPLFSYLFTLLLLAPCAFGQGKSLKLARVEFEGLQRYTQQQAVEASGLKLGQNVDETLLDAAANRLLQTGFFKNIGYRVRGSSGQATVTFQVEETADKGVPVLFDNFVWFSNDELTSAIRREIASFDGTVLQTGNVADQIRAILQRLLQEKKLPGEVESMPSEDPYTGLSEQIYSVKGVRIPICELSFAGTAAISETELKENSKPLFTDDYSRKVVYTFANNALRALYRDRGYLRARFSEAPVKTLTKAGCKDGVAVTLITEEGLQYTWDKAEWAENKALTTQELDGALSMKAGEIASYKKIDKGLHEVGLAYGKKGYIAARLNPEPQYDDANKRVTFRFKVNEGAQYHMGTLTLNGLSPELTQSLTRQWKLQPGDIYDASYLNTFLENVFRSPDGHALIQKFGRIPNIGQEIKPNSKTQTVNVTIGFK